MNKTILIVDDDMNIGNMLEEALKLEGYSVLRAYSGTEALMLLEKNTPNLVLLDLMLPEVDGFEICKTVREKKDIPKADKAIKTMPMGSKIELLSEFREEKFF